MRERKCEFVTNESEQHKNSGTKYKMIGVAACYSSSRYTADTDKNAEVSTLSGTSITGTR